MIRYRADPPEARLTAFLDEAMAAVFHRPSGITHLLASPAPELLDALAAGPADARDLTARLAERFELDGDAEAVIAARLEELAAVGLVRPA
jgi:PqqD family protein of HPr-rel-A system